jgi:hypothetical protein
MALTVKLREQTLIKKMHLNNHLVTTRVGLQREVSGRYSGASLRLPGGRHQS